MVLSDLLPLIYSKQEIEIRFKNPASTNTIYKGTLKNADYITVKTLETAKVRNIATVKDVLWIYIDMEQGKPWEEAE